MKKIILFLMALSFALNISAQDCTPLDANIVFRGGYNFLEKQPVVNASLVGDFYFFRFALNFNYIVAPSTGFQSKNMPSFSPAIGVTYGDRNMAYFMCGAQPSGIVDRETQKVISQDKWRITLEAGYEIRLNDLLFISIGANYFLPVKDTQTLHYYQNLSLMAGLGFHL